LYSRFAFPETLPSHHKWSSHFQLQTATNASNSEINDIIDIEVEQQRDYSQDQLNQFGLTHHESADGTDKAAKPERSIIKKAVIDESFAEKRKLMVEIARFVNSKRVKSFFFFTYIIFQTLTLTN
jgi:hypothetical protein